MKILSVTKIEIEQVETDKSDYNLFRRYSSGEWEVLMGESWESEYHCEELECAYREFKKGSKKIKK